MILTVNFLTVTLTVRLIINQIAAMIAIEVSKALTTIHQASSLPANPFCSFYLLLGSLKRKISFHRWNPQNLPGSLQKIIGGKEKH